MLKISRKPAVGNATYDDAVTYVKKIENLNRLSSYEITFSASAREGCKTLSNSKTSLQLHFYQNILF